MQRQRIGCELRMGNQADPTTFMDRQRCFWMVPDTGAFVTVFFNLASSNPVFRPCGLWPDC
eukprot:3776127-Amphidinium_carterae.1